MDVVSKDAEQSLEFILTHFQCPIYPRTISTYATNNAQVLIRDKETILQSFATASYKDCRISAYPDYTSFKEINRTPPSFFMCDLDLKDFNFNIKALDKALKATEAKIRFKMGGHPTILKTGGGYHIYQPVDGFILEGYSIFAEFAEPRLDLTSRFIRFAEAYFTNGRYDHNHNPTVKSCLVRVPNTFNSKYQGGSSVVKIIKEWDGNKPKINWILRDFRRYLIQEKIDNKIEKIKTRNTQTRLSIRKIHWIDKLLESPIDDYRKNAVTLILAPYLINIKRLSANDALVVITGWLEKCSLLRQLDSNFGYLVKYALGRSLNFGYKPLRLESLKHRNRSLFNLMSEDV